VVNEHTNNPTDPFQNGRNNENLSVAENSPMAGKSKRRASELSLLWSTLHTMGF